MKKKSINIFESLFTKEGILFVWLDLVWFIVFFPQNEDTNNKENPFPDQIYLKQPKTIFTNGKNGHQESCKYPL